jgi:hypothetical protein
MTGNIAMDPKLVTLILVAIAAVLAIVGVVARSRRSARQRRRFGAEYDRIARMTGAQKAETILLEREKRVEKLTIRSLGAEERERFITEWRSTQSRFVDDPRGAVDQADPLVQRLMQTRGYTATDFEQRAADTSVAHASVVDNYRAAHQVALRRGQGHATTEDFRNAIIYYRSLFAELLRADSISRYKEVA